MPTVSHFLIFRAPSHTSFFHFPRENPSQITKTSTKVVEVRVNPQRGAVAVGILFSEQSFGNSEL